MFDKKILNQIKFIYFDFNGVLARETSTKYDMLGKIFDIPEEEYEELNQGLKRDPRLNNLFKNIGSTENEENYLREKYIEVCTILKQEHTKEDEQKFVDAHMNTLYFELIPGVIETLDFLQDKYELGIISNARPSRINEIRNLGLDKYFSGDTVILSTIVNHNKTEKEIFKIGIERSGVRPNEILYFDDKKKYSNLTRELGINAFHVGSDLDGIVELIS